MKRLVAVLLVLGPTSSAAPGLVPADGDLDPSFQDGGKFVYTTPTPGAKAVAVAADGRLLIGYTYTGGTPPDTDMRLLPVPDVGVTTHCGAYFPDQGGTDADVLSDIVRDGDVVYLVGSAAGTAADPDPRVAIGAVDLDTCLLTGFGGADGVIINSASPLELPHAALSIGGDLRVAAQRGAGADRELRSFGVDSATAVIDGNFSLQTVNFEAAFGASFFEPRGIAKDPLGRIVVVGTVEMPSGDRDVGVVRLGADGDPDTTFSGDGLTAFSYSTVDPGIDEGNAVAFLPDGRIVVGGTTEGVSEYRAAIAVLTPTGGFDSGFGTSGRYSFLFADNPFASEEVHALATQGDGKIVAVGGSSFLIAVSWGIARLNATGAAPLDPTFSGDGRRTLNVGSGGLAGEIAVDVTLGQGGRISVVGNAASESGSAVAAARFWNSYVFADGFEWGVLLETDWSFQSGGIDGPVTARPAP